MGNYSQIFNIIALDCDLIIINMQEFYSGGSDNIVLAWAPPSPATKGGRGHAPPRSRMRGVYDDAWSSDEED